MSSGARRAGICRAAERPVRDSVAGGREPSCGRPPETQVQGPRIGDKELDAASVAGLSTDARLLTRVAAAVASPLGVLVLLPGLVFALGAWLTAAGQRTVENSARALALEQLGIQNGIVAEQIALALGQADAVLERLRSIAIQHGPDDPLPEIAFPMRDLLQGRPGLAYVSVSYPDGTFQGTYVDDDPNITLDSERKLRFQDSRVGANGTAVRRFATEERGKLALLVEEVSKYDPRQRDFYALASASAGPAWTKPYSFFKSHFTGITRTEAIRGGDGAVRAVLTVDFDVNQLSSYLEHIPLSGSRIALYGDDGSLLADPAHSGRLRAIAATVGRVLHIEDVKDPVLDAFFREPDRSQSEEFTARGARYVVNVTGIGDPTLGWHIVSFVPEEVLLAPARSYERRAVLTALASVLIAVAIAILLARHVVRMRRQTAAARAEATRAVAAARDLGSYRLTERLGVGGMGEVWRAEHRLLARQAAIKLIRPEAGSGPEAHERFRREAQTLATLRSRNTIELFDYGITEEGTFFYVMELLDGMDLETLVVRHGGLPPARVCSLLMQACSSLAEAHASGLVHRDIKPANLYICRAADEVDVLKVLDFGLVRSLADEVPEGHARSLEELARDLDSGSGPLPKLTAAGAVMGTPEFMAPEQILGLDTDARADIYALGCVAYYALTGACPFTGKDALAIMMAHLQSEAPPLVERCRKPPQQLVDLIARCMAKKAPDRPPSVSAIRLELASIVFPADEAWTEEDASDWWDAHVPRLISAPSLGPLSRKSA
jgi:serine/threonine protein kinase